jgi:pimeloyl-ACP methyl ester carboxylesterase
MAIRRGELQMECQLKNINVHYKIYGEGHPLISLHGFSPNHRSMSGCLEPILEHRSGWQRIYPDLPGMGKTPGKEWITNSDQMLSIILEFMDQVIPNQRFVLAGDSYGSYLARGIIYRRPAVVDGLLLICPMIVPNHAKRSVPPHVTLVKDPALLSGLESGEREEFESFAVVQSQRIWERTRDEVLTGIKVADEGFLTRLQAHGYPFSFDVDAAPPFEKPTLILVGRQDAMVGYRDAWEILENYPRGTFAVLDRAGHNLQIEQEVLFDALVNEWLDRIEENLGK